MIMYQRPILSEDLENRIGDAIQSFQHRRKWKEWGLDRIRPQGMAILLHGPPGTGKTITAYYIGRKLHLKVSEVSAADYGSHIPGELARNIKKIFRGEMILAEQDKKQNPIILLDECDAMVNDRRKLGADMMWMLEPINALLNEISRYPGLVILATNLVSMLDEALERRLIAKIYIGRPDYQTRIRIWQSKWPKKFPVQPNEAEFGMLATSDLSGAQIENVFLLWCGRMIRIGKEPLIRDLIGFVNSDWQQYFEEAA
jgi:SpoVK/Ycf46/Vps4 family AAA+-type ATPase